MERSAEQSAVSGAVGGLVAGGVVATWFLVVDLAGGGALATPSELARIFFGLGRQGGGGAASLPMVAGYTVLHLGSFALLGAATAAFMAFSGLRPGLLLGAVFGVVVLDGAHYGSLLLTGADPLSVLPAVHVVGANVAGGLALMGYLHRASAVDRSIGPAVLADYPVLTEGLVTGLIGAGAVALWFFVIDLLAGQPFFTPAALGSALFLGASSAAEVQVTAGMVSLYTLLHVAAFWAAGSVFVLAARQMERQPGLTLVLVLSFVVLEAVFLPLVGHLGEWVMGDRSWWASGIGNLLAVLGMGWRVWTRHPGLRENVTGEPAASGT